MYYQLTLQFATSEIDDAKKVLELAKELDLKRAGLEETKSHKNKANEPSMPLAKDLVAQEEPVYETAKSTPEPVKPTHEPDQAPAAPAKEITLEELQKAGVAFAKEKGVAVLKVLLTQMGASKICEIPKEKYQEAWEALHA